ncbi:SDR family NAD(P)-dependent oxidoreductase [Taibaiella koreensis]|uniref:SDR family NAD(P)-dependent oxidoreductase n=1 Tax=Taibaiella koreensis TaxID=1268548 RepID=UPI000E59C48E|nr:SDR family NAD(P)-dependent oxidoreductase [Taibaiella koreensis]
METKKVWLVTGASKGLGLSLVKKLLQEGFRVVATTRDVASLTKEIPASPADFLPLAVRLTDNDDVKKAIEQSIAHFGQLDVVVNNAGYGQIGTLEELTDEEARSNFDVNVFGALNVIRNVMPYLRERRSGHVINIASVGGYFGSFPGWGIYCATKFALAGLTESLAEEIREFGLKATVIYPGYFRTDFLSQGSIKTPQRAIGAYEAARKLEQAHLDDINGNQANDPEKAAGVLIAISREKNPPVHLFLGQDAYGVFKRKNELIANDVAQWQDLTVSTAITAQENNVVN